MLPFNLVPFCINRNTNTTDTGVNDNNNDNDNSSDTNNNVIKTTTTASKKNYKNDGNKIKTTFDNERGNDSLLYNY